MASISVKEAADRLGLTTGGIYYRIKQGELKAHHVKGRTYVDDSQIGEPNGQAPREPAAVDDISQILAEMSDLVRRLKKALHQHDQQVRRTAISDLASSLIEAAKRAS